MKKLIVLAAVVAAVWFFGKPLLEKGKAAVGADDREAHVRARVTAVLQGMKVGGSGLEAQTAICQWVRGVPLIRDQGELGSASDSYDRFRRQKGLDHNIGSYAITEISPVEGSSPQTDRVTMTIDGGTYKMTVPDGQPISWAS